MDRMQNNTRGHGAFKLLCCQSDSGAARKGMNQRTCRNIHIMFPSGILYRIYLSACYDAKRQIIMHIQVS